MYQFELDLVTEEEWRPIPGNENYLVSNKGRVKGVFSGAILAQQNKCGYLRVGLCIPGTGRRKAKVTKTVHRLVALAFIPNPESKPHINHINGIKHDNRAENLEWVTCGENIRHAWKTGLMKARIGPSPLTQGERHWGSFFKEADIREIHRLRSEGMTHKAIAAKFGTSRRYIGIILQGKKWKHLNLTAV